MILFIVFKKIFELLKMGVCGLWKVLASSSNTVNLESLCGKKLAVDASIWIYQLVRGIRENENENLFQLHILGFFKRICKLLFFGIKPIFVFDGSFPELKKETIKERIRKREENNENFIETAEKLLRIKLLKIAEKNLQNVSNKNLNFLNEIEKNKNKSCESFVKKSEFELPDLKSLVTSKDDPRILSKEEYESLTNQTFYQDIPDDLENIDINSESFKKFSISKQYFILSKLRLHSRLRTGLNKSGFQNLFSNDLDFSKFQINQVKKRNLYTQKLMCLFSSEEIEQKRIVGEKDKEYLLLKNQNILDSSLINDYLTDQDEPSKKKKTNDAVINSDSDSEFEFEDICLDSNNHFTEKEIEVQKELVNLIYDTLEKKENSENNLMNLEPESDVFNFKPYSNNDEKKILTVNEISKSSFGTSFLLHDENFIDNKMQTLHSYQFSPNKKLNQLENQEIYENENKNSYTLPFKNEIKKESDLFENQFTSKISKTQNNIISLDTPELKNNLDSLNIFHFEKSNLDLNLSLDSFSNKEKQNKILTNPLNKKEVKQSSNLEKNETNLFSMGNNIISKSCILNYENTDKILESNFENSEVLKIKSNNSNKHKHDNILELETIDKRSINSVESNQILNPDYKVNKKTNMESFDNDDNKKNQEFLLYEKIDQNDLINTSENENLDHELLKKKLNESNASFTQNVLFSVSDQQLLQEKLAKEKRRSETVTQSMINDIQELLKIFGIPYLIAPQEAEAQCAELYKLNLINGIITDDSDCLLFGGEVVYKNVFNQKNFVECYTLKDIKKKLSLNRDNLIDMAFLLGCDYTDGVKGIGVVTASKILKEFRTLIDFKIWVNDVLNLKYSNNNNDFTLLKKFLYKKIINGKLFLSESFPSEKVYNAYKLPKVDSEKSEFVWGNLNINRIRSFLMINLNWSQPKVDEIMVPLTRLINSNKKKKKQSLLTNFLV